MLNNALYQRKSKTCEQYMGQKVKLYRLKKKILKHVNNTWVKKSNFIA